MPGIAQHMSIVACFLLLTALAYAQSIGFTQYPTQVVNGQAHPVAWEAGGANVAVNLLRAGIYQQRLYSGAGTSFTWTVDDDENGATDYALQIIPNGNTAAAIVSGPVWLIEDEDGLLVNGQVISASVSNGPTSSGVYTALATASTIASAASAQTSPSRTAITTATVTISSAATAYTFTTTIASIATNAALETVTFSSGSVAFTTTVALAPTASASRDASRGGGSGLGAGAIVGIVTGVLAVVGLVVLLLWWRRRRQRQRYLGTDTPKSPITAFINGGRRALTNRKSAGPTSIQNNEDEKALKRESLVSPLSLNAPSGLGVAKPTMGQDLEKTFGKSELAGSPRHEMSAVAPVYEMAAEDVSADRGSTTKYPALCTSLSRAGTLVNSAPGRDGSVTEAVDKTL